MLLRRSLEAAVAELGRRVDELEVDLLQGGALRVHQQRLKPKRTVLKTQSHGIRRPPQLQRTISPIIVHPPRSVGQIVWL